MDRVDCVVIGAGVVGLATARALALSGREVMVLEAHAGIGMGTSSRNSEVIHAGIYYPEGSLKAELCVRGKAMLYEYCRERGIGHRQLGKLIVAVDEDQTTQLEGYIDRAAACGVNDLRRVGRAELADMEPEVCGVAAVHSPSTGIVDSHEFMLNLHGDIENHGGLVVFNAPVSGAESVAEGLVLDIGGAAPVTLLANTVVNAAGLYAQQFAGLIRGLNEEHVPACHYARGHYFVLEGRSPFERLVYPIADQAGLGVHVTLDMGGQARFGPDVEWVDQVDYRFDESRKADFVTAIRRYYPDLDESRLNPAYVGVRPKIVGPGAAAGDFVISTPRDHGVSGLVNLFGIESPGLTASLAIAERVSAACQLG